MKKQKTKTKDDDDGGGGAADDDDECRMLCFVFIFLLDCTKLSFYGSLLSVIHVCIQCKSYVN